MNTRPTRFGLGLGFVGSVAETVEKAKRAADVGFDVVMVGDHLGDSGPLPTLVAIADAVPSIRISTLVINAPLYRPALLARDLATVDAASGGRLEIGLGSGYVEGDFAGAGVPFPSAVGLLRVGVQKTSGGVERAARPRRSALRRWCRSLSFPESQIPPSHL